MKFFVFFVRILSAFIMLFSPNIIYNQVSNSKAISYGFVCMYTGKIIGLIVFLVFLNSAVTFLYKSKDQY